MTRDTSYWYHRTIDHLTLTGRADRTADTYAREVRILGHHLNKPLEEVGEEDLREFILYRRNDCQLSNSSMQILYCGLKVLYQDIMGKEWPLLKMVKSQREKRLPVVIHREDIRSILSHTTTAQHMTYLRTVYSCGLRLSEALHLTIHDVKGKLKQLHVRGGKGAKDRFVPLPMKTYHSLQDYWQRHRNPLLIFPALGRGGINGSTSTRPMSVSTVQGGLNRALKSAGLAGRGIRMHTLRHSYATHLLESGVNIKTVQEYLGHTNLQATMVYLHLTNWGREEAYNKINQIMQEI
ncbi:MAG: site-specific integrase [Candidatus Fermentibacteria bacterium]|nr:site-specific integrase [Candidatus Fermentibacteria bacterium]